MDKQELERQRGQILAERQQFYSNHPELADWVKKRKIIRNILLIYWILHSVISFILMMQMQTMDGIGMEVFKLLIQLFWLFLFLNPEGSWKINLIVYIWAVSNFALLLMNASNMLDTIQYIPYMPLLGVVMLMEFLVPFLLLGVALYLTAVPKHRAMSEEVEDMLKGTMQKMKDMTR